MSCYQRPSLTSNKLNSTWVASVILAAEDGLSESVLRRLLRELRVEPADQTWIPPRNGNTGLRKRLQELTRTARSGAIVVVQTDLDMEVCPGAMRHQWLSEPSPPNLIFSIAVREVDAWLLGDVQRLSETLKSTFRLTEPPESLRDPKSVIVASAARSRSREVREDFQPRRGALARVGPGYNTRLSAFVNNQWRPHVALQSCPSLRRLWMRLKNGARTT
jgi:hypothetical protein